VARRGTIRASDEDRDRVIERLRKAAAEGRIAAHELEHRVAAALKAQTYGELDATVTDLPAERRQGRPTAGRWALSTVRSYPLLLLVAIPIAMVVVAAVAAIVVMWSVAMLLAFVLGHRRGIGRGPWAYIPHRQVPGPRRPRPHDFSA
jgi:hypothetical protein